MSKLLKFCIALTLVGSFSAAFAAHDPALEQQMRDCFEKHSQVMDKPALKNIYDCYRVHGYAMK